jgi:hypothetical protein
MRPDRCGRGHDPEPATPHDLAAAQRAISGADMETALASGHAAPYSQAVTFIVRYQDAWWLATQAGWQLIPPAVAAVLTEHAARLQHPDTRTAMNRAAVRAVMDLARNAASRLQITPAAGKSAPGRHVSPRAPSGGRPRASRAPGVSSRHIPLRPAGNALSRRQPHGNISRPSALPGQRSPPPG